MAAVKTKNRLNKSQDYSCICLSQYEDSILSDSSGLGFLPAEIYSVKTKDEKNKIFNELKSSNKINLMSTAEFYDTAIQDYKKAIEEYKRLIKYNGNSPLPLDCCYQAPFTVEIFSRIRIAICYQNLKNYKMAIEYYSYGYPWHPFYFEIAECYKKLDDEENAIIMYLKSISHNISNNWSSSPEMAFRAYLEMNDKEGALNCLKLMVKNKNERLTGNDVLDIINCLKTSNDPEVIALIEKIKNLRLIDK